jgi:uncharacterized protein (TIGR02246 family)
MKLPLPLLALALLASPLAGAEPDPQTEATHNELRALRDGLMDAMNKGDIERQLTYVHPNVVVTWHNAEVSRGRDGIRSYYNRLMSGPSRFVEKFSAEVNVDELTILYGAGTGISFGSSVEHFTLTDGRQLDLKGRWSATLVKEDGKWLVASLHVSTNIFDNVILDLAKKYAMRGIAAAAVIGLAVGWLLGRWRRKPAA